ncbi:MAG: ribonuclease HI [Planctomycetaceae bacterium]|jgi:ribonuclease HI|nr:ribonuclease HI [Planctomycetaceae bacterium]
MTEVILYTDGACSGNPGPGGWGFILRHPKSGKEIERSGGDANTTNNQMELTAVIEGLKALTRPTTVEIVSDSKYVLQGLSDWLPAWKRNAWRRKEKGKWMPIKNVELWQELDLLVNKHKVTLTHVKGHSGNIENERCDKLATNAIAKYRKNTH